MRILHQLLLCALLFSIGCKQNSQNDAVTDKAASEAQAPVPIFEKVDPSHSTVFFANHLQEDLSNLNNLFDFDYFYNGAGVGVEDLNNDGLLDIFFCGNQVENRLYINKGNLVFEDITLASGINTNKIWSNAVTFVDINADGWMDIYVSQGGPNTRLSRKNMLLINQKNNTFKDEAETYGLADMGVSTQSVFFDYDKDGDLDCLVMNENEYYGVDPATLARLVNQNKETQFYNSSHLYRNDKGSFTDATKAAGLERPIFGLGLAISDINNDGWQDIYIASDYYIPDALFINNQNGTFTDEIKTRTQQVSFYGMGIDIADINNDNLEDIFVLDMSANDHERSKTLMASMDVKRFDYLTKTLGHHHQYMYNSLQLNTGDGMFHNISQATKTASTDWSWSVLMQDYDLDGDKDIYVTNGYRRYALDNDAQQKVRNAKRQYGKNVPLAVKQQLYNDLPSEKLPNLLFDQTSNSTFSENASEWGLADYTFSNGAAMGDLDNDGDVDLVVNNMDETAFIYKNKARELNKGNYVKVLLKGENSEPNAKISLSYGGTTQLITPKRVRGYRSAQENAAYFGVGNSTTIDTLRVTWDNGTTEERYQVPVNTTQTIAAADAKPVAKPSELKPLFKKQATPIIEYTHLENVYNDFEKEILLPYKQSTLGPFISKGDVNNDGLEDVFIGAASGSPSQLYIANTTGFTRVNQNAFVADKLHEDMESVFFDLDGDKDLDLYVVSGGNEYPEGDIFYTDRIYENDGKGNFSRKPMATLSAQPKNGKTVAAIDIDQDGDKDLIVGNRVIPKNYPKHQPSALYENQNGILVDVTTSKAAALSTFGIVNTIKVTDFNNDGWEDFIIAGEWTGIGMFVNNKGSFTATHTKETDALPINKGWWFDIGETDVNNDGLKDYLVGNIGGNLKFSASEKKPLKIYATDFDDNGSNDIVLSKQYKGEYVPIRGKECSSQQMPFINAKFDSYAKFAAASLVDIYGEKLKNAYSAEATELQSILLLNKGDGIFESHILPIEAQYTPNLSYVFYDLNKDGFDDVIIGGNIYNTEVETPRLDAFSGVVMLSNTKNGYTTLPQTKTGLRIQGNIKDMKLITTGATPVLIATENNGRLQAFDIQN